MVALLRRNIELFGQTPSDMQGIDTRVVCHHLSISHIVKPVMQRKHNVSKEKLVVIDEEFRKLKETGFIEEVKCPT